MISCIVIEDQLPARKVLQKYIKDVEVLDLKGMFSNALDALDYLQNNPVDLLFLDIHLPKLSGIDFLAVLQKRPFVILTTAFPDYALQGYELEVIDYLLKPFSFERFLKAVLKVERQMKKRSKPVEIKKPETILVKVGYELVKIQLDMITHIQANGDYTYLYCQGKKYHASYPLKHWIHTLPEKQFKQVHRSFLVNIKLVDKLSSNHIEIDKTKIPLGRVYKKDFQEVFLKSENQK